MLPSIDSAWVSDGSKHMTAILVPALNHLVEAKAIVKFSVFKVTDYCTRDHGKERYVALALSRV